ncbi:thioesterase [soil metagenome]
MSVEPGLNGHVELVVTEGDTAVAAGSGDVAVLSTPRIVALCEEAAVLAMFGQLPDGETTVGMRIQLDHLAPTAVGDLVTVDAKLEKIQGRRLKFSVSVNDGRGLVAAGKVTRVVVVRDRFLATCSATSPPRA